MASIAFLLFPETSTIKNYAQHREQRAEQKDKHRPVAVKIERGLQHDTADSHNAEKNSRETSSTTAERRKQAATFARKICRRRDGREQKRLHGAVLALAHKAARGGRGGGEKRHHEEKQRAEHLANHGKEKPAHRVSLPARKERCDLPGVLRPALPPAQGLSR